MKPYDSLLASQWHRYATLVASLYDYGDLMPMRSRFKDWADFRAVQAQAVAALGPKPYPTMLFEVYDRLMAVDAIRDFVIGYEP